MRSQAGVPCSAASGGRTAAGASRGAPPLPLLPSWAETDSTEADAGGSITTAAARPAGSHVGPEVERRGGQRWLRARSRLDASGPFRFSAGACRRWGTINTRRRRPTECRRVRHPDVAAWRWLPAATCARPGRERPPRRCRAVASRSRRCWPEPPRGRRARRLHQRPAADGPDRMRRGRGAATTSKPRAAAGHRASPGTNRPGGGGTSDAVGTMTSRDDFDDVARSCRASYAAGAMTSRDDSDDVVRSSWALSRSAHAESRSVAWWAPRAVRE